MIRKHIVCDDCGRETKNVSFDETPAGDTVDSFNHSKILQNDEIQSRTLKGCGWRKRARLNEDDRVVIEYEHYCPDCE